MDTKKVEEQKKKWESSTLEKMLSKAKERKDPFKTLSGIELDRLYTPLDGKDADYSEQIGFPGDVSNLWGGSGAAIGRGGRGGIDGIVAIGGPAARRHRTGEEGRIAHLDR